MSAADGTNVVAIFTQALEAGLYYKKNPHEDDFMNDILDLLDDTKPPRRIGAAAASNQEEEKKDDDFTFWHQFVSFLPKYLLFITLHISIVLLVV